MKTIFQSVIKNSWASTSTPRGGYLRGGVDVHAQELFITDCIYRHFNMGHNGKK